VTSRPEEKYLRACSILEFKDYSCVHVWACIGGDGSKGSLIVSRDAYRNICSASYASLISCFSSRALEIEDGLFRVGVANALLMQYEASDHTARATKQTLHKTAIRLLWWPANSPNFNPIENVCHHLLSPSSIHGAMNRSKKRMQNKCVPKMPSPSSKLYIIN
jgi:hypothetical protein